MDIQSPTAAERPRPLAIMVRYVAFAVVSGAMNLLTQAVVYRFAPVQPLAVSILAGTAIGFVVKYVLDKRWIFFDDYRGVKQEMSKVVLYGLFSVAMTFVFWGFEVAFLMIGGTDTAKYSGGAIGLAIGYYLKYLLDRRFTFNEKARSWS